MELTRRSFTSLTVTGLALAAAAPYAALAEEADAPAEEAASAGTAEAAQQLMDALAGTYVPLFPVLAQYMDVWVEQVAAIVGDEAAEETAEMLLASCMGELTGPDAVEAYTADPESAVFNCDFPEGVATLAIDGGTVSGYDADGQEVFAHTYEYLCYAPSVDFYVFRTDDEDAGEFRYFVSRSDTTQSTYHIEFRMGGDLDDLLDYYDGAYAYWLGAGIAQDYDDELAANDIELFVTENLAAEE